MSEPTTNANPSLHRRDFIKTGALAMMCGASSAGLAGPAGCDLMTQYSDVIIDAMRDIVKDERANILKAADLLSDNANEGRLLPVYGAGGHSAIAAMEIFWRAGGLACVNGMFPVGTNVMTAGPTTAKVEGFAPYIFSFYDVNKGDTLILVNFYGLNITAVDMALEAKKRGVDAMLGFCKDIREVALPIIPAELNKGDIRFFVNPTGRFVIGGPQGDSGLTGRKIIVDTYGGSAPHGGGAFSGKDPTKVDRSAAYAARWIAKNVVAAGLAEKCQIELAYAIGVAQPVSILVDTFGTGKYSDDELEKAVRKVFDLRPTAIIRALDLQKPIYRNLAAYGHMGRTDLDVRWEKTDRVDALREALK